MISDHFAAGYCGKIATVAERQKNERKIMHGDAMGTTLESKTGYLHSLYPDGLQHATPEEKKIYFKSVYIAHHRLEQVTNQVLALLDAGFEKSLILLTGPTGVGKSIAALHLVNTIISDYFSQNPHDLQCIPALYVEAWGPETGRFDWVDLYQELLRGLQVPLIDKSLPPIIRDALGHKKLETPMVEYTGRVTLRALRNRLRFALRQRSPAMIAVDEGSNMLAERKTGAVKSQANTLKSIVNQVSTRMLVVGAYDLVHLSTQSGQLTRRAEVVHFEPYSAEELPHFLEALMTLQAHLPFAGPIDLTPYTERLAKESLGCVGLLKHFIFKALNKILERKAKGRKADWKTALEESYFKPAQLERLQLELKDGYRMVKGREFSGDRQNTTSGTSTNLPSKRARGSQARPGKRNPKRDGAGPEAFK